MRPKIYDFSKLQNVGDGLAFEKGENIEVQKQRIRAAFAQFRRLSDDPKVKTWVCRFNDDKKWIIFYRKE